MKTLFKQINVSFNELNPNQLLYVVLQEKTDVEGTLFVYTRYDGSFLRC